MWWRGTRRTWRRAEMAGAQRGWRSTLGPTAAAAAAAAAAAQATARPAARRCGCHPVSAARASQLTAHTPRHAMITAACRPAARVLWQHAWALPPVCSTWLVSHARAADTCRVARARDSSGRRGTSSDRVNWWPLTRTRGSGCCAPSHLRRTQQLASQNAERIEPSGFGSAEESLQVRRRRFAHRVSRRPGQGAS